MQTDALVACARALSALLNGTPDNHLAMSSLGITAVAVSALDTVARVPPNRHSQYARCRIDEACEALSALMAVFCRCSSASAAWHVMQANAPLRFGPNRCNTQKPGVAVLELRLQRRKRHNLAAGI